MTGIAIAVGSGAILGGMGALWRWMRKVDKRLDHIEQLLDMNGRNVP